MPACLQSIARQIYSDFSFSCLLLMLASNQLQPVGEMFVVMHSVPLWYLLAEKDH